MINNSNDIQNELLKKTEQHLESQILPQFQENYTRVVVAGMKAGLQGGPKSILASLAQSKVPIRDCVIGAVNLCAILQRQARGTIPDKSIIPAAMTLMLHALDFADKAGIMKVGQAELVKASHMFGNLVIARYGITQKMLGAASQKIHGLMHNPGAVEKMKRAAGVVKDPRASTPTEMPQDETETEEEGA